VERLNDDDDDDDDDDHTDADNDGRYDEDDGAAVHFWWRECSIAELTGAAKSI
jgi:hypothetical protein